MNAERRVTLLTPVIGDPFLPRRTLMNKWGYPIVKYGIPLIMMTKDVRVRTPSSPDILTHVANPLYAYRFAPEAANWDTEAGSPWQSMFGDVVSL